MAPEILIWPEGFQDEVVGIEPCQASDKRQANNAHKPLINHTLEQTMSRSNFLDRLQQVSPGIVPFMTASLSGSRAAISGRGGQGKGGGGGGNGTGGAPKGGGEETTGNQLSFPVIFPGETRLTGDPSQFIFTEDYSSGETYSYFAQKTDGNTWQAGSISQATDNDNTNPVTVDIVDIGDALQSAPISFGRNIRIELALYEEIRDITSGQVNDPDQILDDDLTAYYMTFLGGQGKTEVQGARMITSDWKNGEMRFPPLDYEGSVTYQSTHATVDAEDKLKLTIQRVEGLSPEITELKELEETGLQWDGSKWISGTESPDDIIIGNQNLALGTKFGAETNVAGKLIYGVSGKPWQFSNPGNQATEATYLLTFSLENDSLVNFDESTEIRDWILDEAMYGPLPVFSENTEARISIVVPDNQLSTNLAGTHNGLITMILQIPSETGGSIEGLSQ